MLRLRSHNQCPPGEFWYKQAERQKRFGPSPEILSVAKPLSNFRQANGLPRASIEEALADIDAFTCQRQPAWCSDSDKMASAMANPSGGGCPTCGAKVQ
jgi:hypothetical protein